MEQEEIINLLSDEDLDDLFNALDVLRNVHDYGWQNASNMKLLAEKYANGTVYHTRTGLLYERLKKVASIRMGAEFFRYSY
jgi:hypothetical protein